MIMFLAGLFSGVLGGMGIGGGVLLIPALDFFTELTQQQIQGINLIYFIPSAFVAVIIHKKKGNIQTKKIKPLIIAAVIASIIGAIIALSIQSGTLKKLFAVFLLIMGVYEFTKGLKIKDR
ncbi:MAG: TSUP family transporter [Clostridia bacterium]|nr:TSUP family transporter [Clostridia bacterium]MCI1959467.1 TSUP family transporter [Clostridia bacterium]MCI2000959.1 TSUP family transporter [Clostridia bacterium]MCI2015743.1 TSUP family transporter [Clostridia bacterium]